MNISSNLRTVTSALPGSHLRLADQLAALAVAPNSGTSGDLRPGRKADRTYQFRASEAEAAASILLGALAAFGGATGGSRSEVRQMLTIRLRSIMFCDNRPGVARDGPGVF